MILALDLGITTGYAVLYDANGEGMDAVEEYGVIKTDEYPLEAALGGILRDNDPRHIVVEDPVLAYRGKLADDLRAVSAIVSALCPHSVHIGPSQWKPTPWGALPLPSGLSTHERDAIRLGLWFRSTLDTRLQGH